MKDCSGMKADAGKESMMNFSHIFFFFFMSFSCHFSSRFGWALAVGVFGL